jgi:hypothetical protein
VPTPEELAERKANEAWHKKRNDEYNAKKEKEFIESDTDRRLQDILKQSDNNPKIAKKDSRCT